MMPQTLSPEIRRKQSFGKLRLFSHIEHGPFCMPYTYGHLPNSSDILEFGRLDTCQWVEKLPCES